MEYSNPRKEVVVNDWPYSRALRTKCTFTVEKGKGKERAVRVTVNPKTGRENPPKRLTYARKVLFVDGDNGRTYVLNLTGNAISVMQGNMRFSEEYIGPDDSRFETLLAMFEENDDVTTG